MKHHPVLLHIRQHTWLWVTGFIAIGALLANLLPKAAGAAALAYMLAGILVMMRSQGSDPLAVLESDPLHGDDDLTNRGIVADQRTVSATSILGHPATGSR
jgi:hypothetical protein